MPREIMGINQEKLSNAIVVIGYDIIGNVVCPQCGLDGENVTVFDHCLVSIEELLCNAGCGKENREKVCNEIKAQMEHRYGFEKGRLAGFDGDTPIALFACYILEYGNADAINLALSRE